MTLADYNRAVDEWADALYRYILKNLGQSVPAQDMVQDCYEKLWIHRENIDPMKVKSWLFTTAHHTMVDGVRKSRREAVTMPEKLPEKSMSRATLICRRSCTGPLTNFRKFRNQYCC